jgi:SAM-dependent methyltransferase
VPGEFQRDTSTLVHVTTPDAELHARRASSFGAQAAAYAEHRPDYPAAAIDWVLDGVDTTKVLDLAAGTGKLTESLLARGYDVAAVEPDGEMRAELHRRFPSAHALDGTAENIPLPDASVDAVLVGQAFHWFDVPRALAEIARVLRPGGTLGMFWNYEDDRVEWVVEYQRLVSTGVSRGTAQNPFPDDHPVFGTFEREMFDHSVRRTAEGVAAMVATHSHMLVATDAERTVALNRLVAYLKSRPETAEGEFDLPMRTITVRARRQP